MNHVISTFTRVAGHDQRVLACYVHIDRLASGDHVLVVEHLDEAELLHVLQSRERPSFSVIQRFVPTKSGYNHLIQSVYTPELLTLRKCVNPNRLNDVKLSLEQRTATFEYNDADMRHRDISNRELLETVEQIHKEIGTHLEKIVGKEMTRQVAYLKIGDDDQVHFLWSAMISFDDESKGLAQHYPLALASVERHAHRADNQTRKSGLIIDQNRWRRCIGCESVLPSDQIDFLVTMKAVLRKWDARKLPADSETQDALPPIIRKTYTHMSSSRLEEQRQNPSFLYRSIRMCLQCAQSINQSENHMEEQISERVVHRSTNPNNSTYVHDQRQSRQQTSNTHEPAFFLSRRHRSASAVGFPCFGKTGNNVQNTDEKMSRVALHLRRRFGRPSLRYALASYGEYPMESLVQLSVLSRLLGAQTCAVLAEAWQHFNNFQPTNARRQSTISTTTLDIDVMDALLQRAEKQPDRTPNQLDGETVQLRRPRSSAPQRPPNPKPCVTSRYRGRQHLLLHRPASHEVSTVKAGETRAASSVAAALGLSQEEQQVLHETLYSCRHLP